MLMGSEIVSYNKKFPVSKIRRMLDEILIIQLYFIQFMCHPWYIVSSKETGRGWARFDFEGRITNFSGNSY